MISAMTKLSKDGTTMEVAERMVDGDTVRVLVRYLRPIQSPVIVEWYDVAVLLGAGWVPEQPNEVQHE